MKQIFLSFCLILTWFLGIFASYDTDTLLPEENLVSQSDILRSQIKNLEWWEEYIEKIHAIRDRLQNRDVAIHHILKQLRGISERIEGKTEEKYVIATSILDYLNNLLHQELQRIKIENEKNKEPEVTHVSTPDEVKSIYYTAYSAGSSKKIEYLKNLAKSKEINSVTIDIKTVSGYVSFDMSGGKFGDIKPVSDNTIRDIKALIAELHKEGIYVIGRIVVFKDKLLSERRSDLAIKWKWDHSIVWSDYKGLKYLDPGAEEVWEYNANIAKYAYELGFDELNFDYVRYPTDGKISQTYYPHSHTTQVNNPKWWKIMVLDQFGDSLTKDIKSAHPDAVLSADVFWLVTRNDGFMIGQNLESFLLNFDYVGPMIYPSHYGKWFLWNVVPDNAPYAVIKDAIEHTNARVDKLNASIEQSTASGSVFKVKWAFVPSRDVSTVYPIQKDQIRPWLQGFTCTWCKGATEYTRTKFREQIRALDDTWIDSWWVWSSSSRYYWDWYDKD